MIGQSLMTTWIATLGIIGGMLVLSVLCCTCMKLSDLKLRTYIMKQAKRRGFNLDLEKLDKKKPAVCRSPHMNENCTIMIPDVAIVL